MTSLTDNTLSSYLCRSNHAQAIGSVIEPQNSARQSFEQISSLIQDYKHAISINANQENELSIEVNPQIHIGNNQQSSTQTAYAHCQSINWAQLGDASFCKDHGLRFAYMCGAMANGIASAELVVAAANAGILGSYGAAGQSIQAIETAIAYITSKAPNQPFSVNLIHSPNEPEHEGKVVDCLIKHNIYLIEASAYLGLTPAVVRYRLHGIHRNEAGEIITPNKIIGKASRVEVATRWWSPAPQKIVAELLSQGKITAEQAELSKYVPMAQDLTAEADSGGHTDNRPALCMFPSFLSLKNE
ncbi:MAG: 2-nitropropane dioxygenase, partial [Planctomycetes bacterium]|nr:2-nitropropane dioxygenase [Planctomycetota bacterium]